MKSTRLITSYFDPSLLVDRSEQPKEPSLKGRSKEIKDKYNYKFPSRA